MRRHGKVAIEALALAHLEMARANDVAEAPHRDVAPALDRREEAPVRDLIAEPRVCHIVGGEGELVHADEDLAGPEVPTWRVTLLPVPTAQIVLGHAKAAERLHGTVERHGGPPRAGNPQPCFRSSMRPIWLRCTSSGPSKMRMERAWA